MQIILVLGIILSLTIFGSSQMKKYSMSPEDVTKSASYNYAGNLYMYNDFSLQYIYSDYSDIVNSPNVFVNNIAYKTSNNFNINKLTPFYSKYINFKPQSNYNSTYFLYSKSNGQSADIPQIYIFTTFDNKNEFAAFNMFGAYNNLITAKDNPGDVAYWTTLIFGEYNGNAKPTILSSIPSNTIGTINNTLTGQVFPALTKGGFKIQKYFIIIPVYMNN